MKVEAASWDPILEISNDTSSYERQFFPSVAVDNGSVHIVWCEDVELSGWEIMYRNFNGLVWSEEQIITQDPTTHFRPSMDADNGLVHLVWEYYESSTDQDIYYSNYNGISWSTPIEISTDTNNEDQSNPTIVADGNKCYVFWGENGEVCFREFNGKTWLNEQVGLCPSIPAVAVDNGKIYLTWADDHIYFKYFDGTAWSDSQYISGNVEGQYQNSPAIAAENGKVFTAWVDYSDGNPDIYYRYFNGTIWESAQEISTDTGVESQSSPSIAVDQGRVHVVWIDNGNGSEDVLYRLYEGSTWKPEEKISYDISNERQDFPDIAVENNHIYIVWQDYKDGEYPDIYYRYKFEYLPPLVSGIKVQGSQDIKHITDHTPMIEWTYFDYTLQPQKRYNISIWSGEIYHGYLMGYKNNTSENKKWTYSGLELFDGKTYRVYIKVYNGHKWSKWYYRSFTMNTAPPMAYDLKPDYNETIDMGMNNYTFITWQLDNELDEDDITIFLYGDFNTNPPLTERSFTQHKIKSYYSKIENISEEGIYYWQIKTYDGYEWTNGSVWSLVISRNDNPVLTNCSVFPTNGNITTLFNFSVDYKDMDGDLPGTIHVIIDNISYDLLETNKSDINVKNGKNYYFKLKLNNSQHRFYFNCIDGKGGGHSSNVIFGPIISKPDLAIIKGLVKDSETGIGMEANITITNKFNMSESYNVKTDPNGTYELKEILIGTYEIFASADGYINSNIIEKEINPGQWILLNFKLIKQSSGDTKVTQTSIIVGKTNLYEGESLEFIGRAVDKDGDRLTYTWHFEDDGQVIDGQSITHKFEVEGKFRVTLIVKDADGNNDSAEISITVKRKEKDGNDFFTITVVTIIIIIIILLILILIRKRKEKYNGSTNGKSNKE